MDQLSDIELFDRFRGHRDAAALECLIKRHVNSLFTVALRILNNAADAEDAVQDALIRVIKSAHRYDSQYPLKPWLLQKSADAARDLRRKRYSQETKDRNAPPPAASDSVEDHPLSQMQRSDLEKALADLDEELQLPLILYYYEKLTQAQIGEMIGCSHQTVQKRIVKGLEKLKYKIGLMGVVLTGMTLENVLNASTVTAAPATLSASLGGLITANLGLLTAAGAATGAGASAAAAKTGGTVAAAFSGKTTLWVATALATFAIGTQTPRWLNPAPDRDTELTNLRQDNAALSHANRRLAEEIAVIQAPDPAAREQVLRDALDAARAALADRDTDVESLRTEVVRLQADLTALRASMAGSPEIADTAPAPEPAQDYTLLEDAIRRDPQDRQAIYAYRGAIDKNRDWAYATSFYDTLFMEIDEPAGLVIERGAMLVSEFGLWTALRRLPSAKQPSADESLSMWLKLYNGLLAIRDGLRRDGDNRYGLRIASQFAIQLGEYGWAFENLRHLADLQTAEPQPEDKLALTYTLLIQSAIELGKLDDAKRYWNAAVQAFPTDQTLYQLKEKYGNFEK